VPNRAERGCLAIADISGYTGYLTGTELEHAHDVLADLMRTVVGALRPRLRLVKLEGDAAFAYALEGRLDGPGLIDTVEGCYFTFRRRLRDIQQATTCPCNACLAIPSLNLKVLVHAGEFVRQRIAGYEDLTGTDVIVIHRLLKNTVARALDSGGYGLFTAACVAAMGLDPAAHGMREHGETYDHIGEVLAYVYDLDARWRDLQQRTRVIVAQDEADVEIELAYPGPPALVWEYLTTPGKRILYQAGATRIDQANPNGRRGPGTTTHCVHGDSAIREEILDWRPFEYFTERFAPPGLTPAEATASLTPTETGTRVIWRVRLPRARKAREAWEAAGDAMTQSFRQSAERMRELIAAEIATEIDATPAPAEPAPPGPTGS
jgi:uncharacterized protein YndB with AHSA1/START domain